METTTVINVKRTTQPTIQQTDFNNLEFGKHVSDHMLVCDYADGEWQQPQIIPYGDMRMSPLTLALHYGQTVFEGMKAFRLQDGRINIFRMDKHYDRFVRSLERMCMAVVPKEIFMEGMMQLIHTDQAWVPGVEGTSLYIRPFVFASEARMGVKIAEQYRFMICTGPVPALYAEPVKVKVETGYVRAGKGGTGFAKCGGNYGGAFLPTQKAKEQGYDQVLWTDGKENKFIEESGTMNVMFVIGDKLVTPALSDTILDGVTRDSLLTLAKDLSIETEARPVSITELEKAFADRTIRAAFGAGTAAVIAPIRTISINGVDHELPAYEPGNMMFTLKNRLNAIRTGAMADIHGWNFIV
jgi:branched-chain amino acid aminotransferase